MHLLVLCHLVPPSRTKEKRMKDHPDVTQQFPALFALRPDFDWDRIINRAKSIPNKPVARIEHNLRLLEERFGTQDAKERIEANGFLLMHPETANPVGEQWTNYMGQKRMGGTLEQRKKYKDMQRKLRRNVKHQSKSKPNGS